ncbi:MAG: ribulose-phosphate 3-epimerase, partial [Candidatus Margulisbacteria bacterium]|nr:ribulose-phosphate 3-epimerase [Candidatus Margulisiibacteriota bacterium]
MGFSVTAAAYKGFNQLSIQERIGLATQGIRQAKSPEEAIRVALQLGAIRGLCARGAQMYWITRTPKFTSVKTLKVYKWLRPETLAQLKDRGLVLKVIMTKNHRVLTALNPDAEEITTFAAKKPLSETHEMDQVIMSMQPLIVMNPERRAHLKDHKPFILFPVRVSPDTCAVFKLKFERDLTKEKAEGMLPHLHRLFSILSNHLGQIETLFGHRTESYTLRIEKQSLATDNLLGISILAGPPRTTRIRDLSPLIDRIARAQALGVDLVHLDVMDGEFNAGGSQYVGPVTSKTDPKEHFMVLADFLAKVQPRIQLPIDTHLMVQDPITYIVELIKIGVDLISISAEMNAQSAEPRKDLRDLLLFLNRYDVHVGLVLNPGTPLTKVQPYLGIVDVVTLMTVITGASGQKFMPQVVPKIAALRDFRDAAGLELGIQVDGGINQQTVRYARETGANIAVAASALYRQHNLA